MPNRKVHRDISVVAGVGVGLYAAHGEPIDVVLASVLGGVCGACVGGALPDGLEPGTNSWHRKTFHSVAAGGAVSWLALNAASDFRGLQATLRSSAAALREQRMALPPEHPERLELWAREMGSRATMAALAGLAAGYLLHLVADSTTPRGLPLI